MPGLQPPTYGRSCAHGSEVIVSLRLCAPSDLRRSQPQAVVSVDDAPHVLALRCREAYFTHVKHGSTPMLGRLPTTAGT
jgi:hypothetical protein